MQTFRDFMESALYEPGRGFYSRRTPTADFYTAPELHPAFGGVLARELARRLDGLKARGVPGPYSIVEMGSGSGLLAKQVLEELRRARPDWADGARYVLVERSREVLLQSVLSLSGDAERVLGCSSLAELPPVTGVVFSNELVDAFPVHLLEKSGGEVREVFVTSSGEERLGALSCPELAPHAAAVAESLEEGGRHAVNLEASEWLKGVSEKLQEGWLVTVDYGRRFAGEANAPRTFRRHRTDDRLTEDRGGKDLTASVDFEHLIREGRRLGLALESFQTLGSFLIERGVWDWLEATGREHSARAIKERAQIKTLIHPEGMGEVFKVLVQARSRA